MADAATYLHILAFECPSCETPILESTLSNLRNLESVDATAFHLGCSCGWTSRWLGAQARGHLVLPWSASSKSSGKDIDNQAEIGPDTVNPV